MKIQRLNWDKDKHGLIWKISDVFSEEELDYIKSKLPVQEIGKPPKAAAKRIDNLERLRRTWHSRLKDLYAQFKEEYKEENIPILCPDYWNTQDVWTDMSLQGTARNLNYRIHADVVEKLLTFVVYVYPEIQEPTYFHEYNNEIVQKFKEDDISPIRAVPWEINTGYMFIANNKSLHSYSNMIYNTDRYIVIANLRRAVDNEV